MSNDLVPYSDLERMAQRVVESRLFPVKTAQEAITLFLVAQAEGMHPMTAMRRYDIIQGKPAMKTDAMLAGFFARGGKVKWHELSDSVADATFTSTGVPEGLRLRWDMARAEKAGLASKPTWRQYPRQMLRSRVVREGINATDPETNQGMYTPEEVADFDNGKPEPPRTVKADAEILADPGFDVEERPLGQVMEQARENREEAIAKHVNSYAAPAGCPECGSPIGSYESEQEKHKGRMVWQCEKAREKRNKLIAGGMAKELAQAKVAKHFRGWAEPPKKEEGAGTTPDSAATGQPPTESTVSATPAPSFSEQLAAVQSQVAEKLAKENK